MNTPATPLAAIYLRLSKDRADQTSTARQEADCREAAQREGSEVVQVFQDLVSGYRAGVQRPGFEEALDWVTAAPGRVLYVWKLDRLSRRGIGQVGLLLDRLEAAGSRVVFVQEGLDSGEGVNRSVIALLAEQARQESANTSTRTRSALAHRRALGLWPGGRPPFGFRIATPSVRDGNDPASFRVTEEVPAGRLVAEPDEAALLREMAERVTRGASLYEVCKWANAEGFTTARGGDWRVQTLRVALRSPVLVGWLPERKGSTQPSRDPETREPVEVGEAVLTLAERARLLAALEARSRTDERGRKVSTGPKRRHLLTGVLRCALCGSAMAGGGTPPKARYICTYQANGGNCPGNAVTLTRADEYISDRALRRWAAMEPDDPVLEKVAAFLLGRPVVDPLGRAERDALEAELAEHQARLDDLTTLRLEPEFRGEEGAERFARLRNPLLAAIARTEEALRSARLAEPNLGPLLDPTELREAWDGLDIEAKRAALQATFEVVRVRKGARGKPWNPEQRFEVVTRQESAT